MYVWKYADYSGYYKKLYRQTIKFYKVVVQHLGQLVSSISDFSAVYLEMQTLQKNTKTGLYLSSSV